jgi:hypothetical protein
MTLDEKEFEEYFKPRIRQIYKMLNEIQEHAKHYLTNNDGNNEEQLKAVREFLILTCDDLQNLSLFSEELYMLIERKLGDSINERENDHR